MPIIVCRASTIFCSRRAITIASACATRGRRMNLPDWLFSLAWLFGCPLVISWVLTAILIRWAPRLGLVDYPSDRKVHTRPTPRGGGLAIFIAVIVSPLLLAVFPFPFSLFHFQLLLSAAIVFLGLFDDLRPLPWPVRL